MTGRPAPRAVHGAAVSLVILLACAGSDLPPMTPAGTSEPARGPVSEAQPDPEEPAARVSSISDLPAAEPFGPAPSEGTEPEVWLKGSTHVHGRASGDSSEPNAQVVAWYEHRGYDFIALTDHNRVSELDAGTSTRGQIALRDPRAGLIVLSGIELTHNPVGCLPAGDPSGNCRIHVNLLGPTARPTGRIEWAERRSHERLDMYAAALAAQARLGGLAQINHPQWLWGMQPDLLAELARRGVRLVEIANAAFSKWNVGDATHPSTEALWDAVLMRGLTLWGTASDDAHDYDGHGKYPPGHGWVVVRARRDPRAILSALAAGRFYASTGVVLDHAERSGDELAVSVAPSEAGAYTIEFIENGRRAAAIVARSARRPIPPAGYVRAVVTRQDGKRAWVQPVRR